LNYVDIILLDSGIVSLIKKNENTKFDIGIASNKSVQISDSSLNYGTLDIVNLNALFEALIDSLTGGGVTAGTYGVDSSYLDQYENDLMLCGTAPLANTVIIKTSLKDFLKSINALSSVGIAIETIAGKETILIKEISYFFQNDQITSFNNVNDFEFSIDTGLIFNKIKVGYPVNSFSNVSSGHEANTTTNYVVNSGNINSELDLTSVYCGDVYGLAEVLRGDVHNDTGRYWFVKIAYNSGFNTQSLLPGNLLAKKQAPLTTFQAFNTQISPARLLLNQKALIQSRLNVEDSLVYSSSGNDNINNQTKNVGETNWVHEYEGITIAKATSMFVPYIFKIDVPLTIDLNSIIGLASTGYISFTYNGNQYKGYIMSAGVKLAGRGVVEMKLLASYDNDFSTLIR
jgi:hypothetical protein